MDTGSGDILETAFHPNAIAVAGASEDPVSAGYDYVRHLLDYGYSRHIYPVNPSKQVVLGLKAYPNLSSISEPVDYVICCLPASKALDLLAECPSRDVKVVQFYTARLSETGRQTAKDLEARILKEARRLGIRLIGPNCMGIYYPRQGISFGYDFPKEAGTVGAVFQSGGASNLLIRYGGLQGLRFSKVISYGNALDLDESDFLHYLAHDDETKIIAAYIEGVKDGTKFLDALRVAAQAKPVLIIKGGRGGAGTKAAVSHTASIAGSDIVWETAFRQAGAIQARDLNELVNLLAAFYFLPLIKGNRVGIIGGDGGKSVMSADACERAGFVVSPLPPEIDDALRVKAPELQGWLGNPADISITPGSSIGGWDILDGMAKSPHFDFIIVNLTEEAPLSKNPWSGLIRSETEGIIKMSQHQWWENYLGAVSGLAVEAAC